LAEQEAWITRQGIQHGFSLPQWAPFDFTEPLQAQVDVQITQSRMLRGKKHSGDDVRIYSVLYDGRLTVIDPNKFAYALQTGIGHGKVMGLGLLSVAPIL